MAKNTTKTEAVVVDYAGTITARAPDGTHLRSHPQGDVVAELLAGDYGRLPEGEGVAAGFDAGLRAYRQRLPSHQALPALIADVLRAHRLAPPPPERLTDVAQAALARAGDHPLDAEAVTALQEIHARGVAVYAGTNTTRPTAQRAATLQQAGLDFVQVLASHDMGCRKPEPEYYHEVLRAVGCPPEEVVFVGDNPVNDVDGPRRCGMRAVLVDTHPPEDGYASMARRLGAEVIAHIRDLPGLLEAA